LGRIAPGDSKEIVLEVDTAGRIGRIAKTATVYSNDPDVPEKVLLLVADLVKSAHVKGISGKNIFHSDCTPCHVDKGKGKTHKALYDADCAICHRDCPGGAAPLMVLRRI
jgi:cytochrome c5